MNKYLLLTALVLFAGLLAAQNSADPDFCNEMLQKARADLKLHEYTRARDYCEAALPLCPGLAAEFGKVQEAVNAGIEKEKQKAREGEETAKKTLAKLQKSNEDFVRSFLKSARVDIAEGRFDDAQEKIKTADVLNVLNPEVFRAYRENADSSMQHKVWRIALESIQGASSYGIMTPDELDRTYSKVVKNSILYLDYEVALKGAKAIAALNVPKKETIKTLLEIAFWFGETGDLRRAAGILDTVMQISGRKIDLKQQHRRAIESFDLNAYREFKERYYPVMMPVEGGVFEMGNDTSQYSDGYWHKKEVNSFQMAKYETTWWQYFLFCKANNHNFAPPFFEMLGNHPTVNVSWFDAVLYANWVNKQFGLDTFYQIDILNIRTGDQEGKYFDVLINPGAKKGYRLPTETEWEYAAGGGNKSRTLFAGTDDVSQLEHYAWYYGNNERQTYEVGTRLANTLGLYDMSGNTWEWCWDWYGSYDPTKTKDNWGAEKGTYRVTRGGSYFGSLLDYCLVARRSSSSPDYRSFDLGFRLVFVP